MFAGRDGVTSQAFYKRLRALLLCLWITVHADKEASVVLGELAINGLVMCQVVTV